MAVQLRMLKRYKNRSENLEKYLKDNKLNGLNIQ